MRDLVLVCNPTISDQLISSRQQLMRYIAANHGLYAEQIKDSLATASSLIHISSDLWTSPHRHAMLAICAQCVDKGYRLEKALLGLPECRDTHSGERQADLIMDTQKRFQIASNLGYHTGDNATLNDTCLVYLARRLASEFSVRLKLYWKNNKLAATRSILMLKSVLVAALVLSSIYLFRLSFSHPRKKPFKQLLIP